MGKRRARRVAREARLRAMTRTPDQDAVDGLRLYARWAVVCYDGDASDTGVMYRARSAWLVVWEISEEGCGRDVDPVVKRAGRFVHADHNVFTPIVRRLSASLVGDPVVDAERIMRWAPVSLGLRGLDCEALKQKHTNR